MVTKAVTKKKPRTRRDRELLHLGAWLKRYAWAYRNYQETQNPVYAWEGYLSVREGDAPIPPWILDYFGRVALNIRQLHWFSVPKAGALGGAVLDALELKPRGRRGAKNPFAEVDARHHSLSLAIVVHEAVRKGTKPDIAFDDVARSHPAWCLKDKPCTRINRATVRRAWLMHKEEIEGIERANTQITNSTIQ